MTEVRFYHLQKQTLDQVLPTILTKALANGHRIVVRGADDASIKKLNEYLWTFRPDSFLPHGSAENGHEADQPIWLTAKEENPNNADVLILTENATSDQIDKYGLCCEMLDGTNDDIVVAARARWKIYKEAGHNVTYWQQTEKGRWDKKAG